MTKLIQLQLVDFLDNTPPNFMSDFFKIELDRLSSQAQYQPLDVRVLELDSCGNCNRWAQQSPKPISSIANSAHLHFPSQMIHVKSRQRTKEKSELVRE